jgi:hypothetical protein
VTIKQVQALTTQTSPGFASTPVDISGITNDWTLCIQIAALSPAGAKATLQFLDSVNSFTASITGPVECVEGQLSASADMVLKTKKYDFPRVRFGVSNALLELLIADLDAGASVTYSSWIEY